MCVLEKRLIEEIGDAESAAGHFVFVGGPDAARCGSDFDASGSVLSAELNHAVIGQNDVGAVADEEIGGCAAVSGAGDLRPARAEAVDFLHEGEGIEHDAVADDSLGLLAENAAGDRAGGRTSCPR